MTSLIGKAHQDRQHLLSDLNSLALRYIELEGDDLKGLAALGEDLFRIADTTDGRTSWAGVLERLMLLSG